MSDPGLAVILAEPDFQAYDALAKVLATFRGVPVFDARQDARRAWGILAENLTPPEAQRLAAEAERQKVPVFIRSGFPPMPPEAEAHSIVWDADRLSIKAGLPAVESVFAWEALRVVSALAVTHETTETKIVKEGPSGTERMVKMGITLATGIPLGFGGKKEVKTTVKNHELNLRFDIFTDSGRFHAAPDRFDFSCLGAKKTPGGFANLRLLLEELAKAPRALMNLGARALRQGKPLTALGYDSARDYEKECRWLFALTHPNP